LSTHQEPSSKRKILYAQIEKELLSVAHCLSRMANITVETDHKPLLAIHKKPLTAVPKRLQRMWLQLQRYDFDLVFRPSSQMILADTLSRAFPQAGSNETEFPEELAALSTVDADQLSELRMVASAATVELINRAARDEDEYAGLIQQIKRGWPDSPADVATYL